MGLFEEFSRFLETRLEEFLRNNPHLELQALEEQLREQEEDTLQLISDLRLREKKLQEDILATAQDIQRWHLRVDKARAAGRLDLAQAAQEREAALLRQGNQLWGQMEGVKTRAKQTQALYQQIQTRRQEVRAKAAEAAAQQARQRSASYQTSGWYQGVHTSTSGATADPLEQAFQRWETEEELDELKRNLGR